MISDTELGEGGLDSDSCKMEAEKITNVLDVFSDRSSVFFGRLLELQDCELHVPYLLAQIDALERELSKSRPSTVCSSVQCVPEVSETQTQCEDVCYSEVAVQCEIFTSQLSTDECNLSIASTQCDHIACSHIAIQTCEVGSFSIGVQTTPCDKIGKNIATQTCESLAEVLPAKENCKLTCDFECQYKSSGKDVSTQCDVSSSQEIQIDKLVAETKNQYAVSFSTPTSFPEDYEFQSVQTEDVFSEGKNTCNLGLQTEMISAFDETSQNDLSAISLKNMSGSVLPKLERRLSKIPKYVCSTPLAVVTPIMNSSLSVPRVSRIPISSKNSSDPKGSSFFESSFDSAFTESPGINKSKGNRSLLPVRTPRNFQLKGYDMNKSLGKIEKDSLNVSLTSEPSLRSPKTLLGRLSSTNYGLRKIGFKNSKQTNNGSWKEQIVYPTSFGKICLKIIEYLLRDKKKCLIKKLAASQRIQRELFEMLNRRMDLEELSRFIAVIQQSTNRNVLEYVLSLSDKMGNTALHRSILCYRFDLSSLLITSCPCMIDQENNAKETAMILAVKRNSLEIVQELVQFGADINHKDSRGIQPIVYAARLGFVAIVQFLRNCPNLALSHTDTHLMLQNECRLPLNAEKKDHKLIQRLLHQHSPLGRWH